MDTSQGRRQQQIRARAEAHGNIRGPLGAQRSSFWTPVISSAVIASLIGSGVGAFTTVFVANEQISAQEVQAAEQAKLSERLAAYSAFDTSATRVRGTLSRLGAKIQSGLGANDIRADVDAALSEVQGFNVASYSVELVSTKSAEQDERTLSELVNTLADYESVQGGPVNRAGVISYAKFFGTHAQCVEDKFVDEARADLKVDHSATGTLPPYCYAIDLMATAPAGSN